MTAEGRLRKLVRRPVVAGSIVVTLVLLTGSPVSAYYRPGRTEIVSVSSAGKRGTPPPVTAVDGGCFSDCAASLNGDGRWVAYASRVQGLVPEDDDLMTDVFLSDRKTGRTRRISVTPFGLPTAGACAEELRPGESLPDPGKVLRGSYGASLSANGRFVVFLSCAMNLVPGDTNLVSDVFVSDRRSGRIERVSVDSDEGQAAATSGRYRPTISGSGDRVAFSSDADLADGATGFSDVFLRDRSDDATLLVSGHQGTELPPVVSSTFNSTCSAISANGEVVVFTSSAPNLVANDPDANGMNVFRQHLDRKHTEIVSLGSRGEPASANCSGNQGYELAVDRAGQIVAFLSSAGSLVPNDGNGTNAVNGCADVFVRDTVAGRTERISATSSGEPANLLSWSLAMSADGRFVAFHSRASNLWDEEAGETTTQPEHLVGNALVRGFCSDDDNADAWFDGDVFVHDRVTGTTEPISSGADGRDTNCFVSNTMVENADGATYPALSGDGRFLAFWSCKEDLSEDDATAGPRPSHRVGDQWVRDRGAALGVGGFAGPASASGDPDDRICIDDVCVPPGAGVSSDDPVNDVDGVLTEQGADLYGAAVTYRPQLSDLLVRVELEHMPQVLPGVASPIFYGLRLEIGGERFEVRATSLLSGTFGLFDCTGSGPVCAKVADLSGGYGTTGMRVVFSLPLSQIGLEGGGVLSKVKAFSAIGSYAAGPVEILDSVRIR